MGPTVAGDYLKYAEYAAVFDTILGMVWRFKK